MTTLQMANLAAIIANKGKYYPPRLAKGFYENGQLTPLPKPPLKQVKVREEFFDPAIRGMERVVTSGTATIAYTPGISICGKTGTSQNPLGADHSVFCLLYTSPSPRDATLSRMPSSA